MNTQLLDNGFLLVKNFVHVDLANSLYRELVDNGQNDDTPAFDVDTGGKFKKRDFTGFDYE